MVLKLKVFSMDVICDQSGCCVHFSSLPSFNYLFIAIFRDIWWLIYFAKTSLWWFEHSLFLLFAYIIYVKHFENPTIQTGSSDDKRIESWNQYTGSVRGFLYL